MRQEERLLRDFLADLVAASLLGNMTCRGGVMRYDDRIEGLASHEDLLLIRRARRLLKLKPLKLRMTDWPDKHSEAHALARAWAYGRPIAPDGTIAP